MFQVSLKKFQKDHKISLKYQIYELLFDISKEEFLEQIIFFYQNLLYPLYFAKKKIVLNSFPFPKEALSISPILLHTNQEAIKMHLYLESFWSLEEEKEKETLLPKEKIKIDQLNKEQQKAVQVIDGAICLLAPAGSGKTKTLVSRVSNLLNHGISPFHILVLVFNKKAEQEIKERLSSSQDISIHTFHSFGNKLLQEYTDFEFFQESPKELVDTLLEQAISKHHKLVYGKEKDPLQFYREKLSEVKNNLLSQKEMVVRTSLEEIDFYPIFQEYLHLLKEEKLYDYDDMLYLAVSLLLKNGSLRRKVQKRYQYLLVDEFQDLNPIQLLFLKIIALPENNLFVVGDDDQMIYGFRGASVDAILGFKKEYPKAMYLKLSTNYRSSKKITYHARCLIEHNLSRIHKNIKANTSDLGEVKIKVATNFLEEAKEIEKWLKKIPATDSVAILYRYQSYGWFLKLYFSVVQKDSLEKEVTDYFHRLFLLLRTFFGPFSKKDAGEIMPLFGLKYDKAIHTQEDLLKVLNTKAPFLKIKETLTKKDVSFRTLCLNLNLNSTFFFPEEQEDKSLFLFLTSVMSYFKGIHHFYQETSKKRNKENKNITFATIHKTKGNEFDHVCYFHMEQKEDTETEEERRISYVAVTRAKKNLLITVDSTKKNGFLKEYLFHPKFSNIETKTLKEKLEEILLEIKDNQSLLSLKKKDMERIKSKPNYQIMEEVEGYYQKYRKDLDSLQRNTKKLLQEEFQYQEELEARELFFSSKYDIIGQEKRGK